jgi:toxin-antitoxin system PIN domain toxin
VTRPALLDVNVLVALFDAGHVHHEAAHDWFADHRSLGWATCPTTENGFIRVLSNPKSGTGATPSSLREGLRAFCGSGHHAFWPDRLSLRDEIVDLSLVQGHRQLTDIYLLGLAVEMRGVLATFDRSIPLRPVKGARPEMLTVIGPAADDGHEGGV